MQKRIEAVTTSTLTQVDAPPAERLIRVPVPLVRQPDGYTCGVASLQSVLHYFGHVVRFDRLAAALGANPKQGTNYQRIAEYAQAQSINVTIRIEMTLGELLSFIDAGLPVIVALQAWGSEPEMDYVDEWDDGHYVVVVGYDDHNLYFMDPSTLGNYTFIPLTEFLARWHDCYDNDHGIVRLHRFGMAFQGDDVQYDSQRILHLR